jgi:hypothetical protein
MDLNVNLKDINMDKAKNLSLDKSLILIVFKKYKDYLLPIVVIIISLVILFFVLIPQFGQYSASKQELNIQTQKRDLLLNNYNFLNNLDQAKLDSDLKLLTRAFPVTKDFVGIITALSAVSAKTGVSVGDFGFAVGNLSKDANITDQVPQIKVDLTLRGDSQQIKIFLFELYKTAPILEIKSVRISGASATVTIVFYYKPYPPTNISDSSPIVPLSAENTKLLEDILTWNNVASQEANLIPMINLPLDTNATSSSSQINTSPFN